MRPGLGTPGTPSRIPPRTGPPVPPWARTPMTTGATTPKQVSEVPSASTLPSILKQSSSVDFHQSRKSVGRKHSHHPSHEGAKPKKKPAVAPPGFKLAVAGKSKASSPELQSTTKAAIDKVVEESRAWVGEGETVLHIDEEIRDKKCSEAYVDGFRQYKYLAGVLFRFPVEYHRIADGRFEFYWQYLQGLGFFVTSGTIFFVTIAYVLNLVSIILNSPMMDADDGVAGGDKWNARAEEMYIFYRNIALGVVIGMLLFHVNAANWRTFRKRTYIYQYFGYCANSLDLMQVHAAQGLQRFNFFMNFGFVSFVLVIIAMMVFRVSPITSGGPGFIGMLLVRIAYPSVYRNHTLYITLRIYAQAFMIYLILAAKLYVMLFIWQCRVLEGAFRLWNQRLDLVLNRGDDLLVLEDRLGKRTNFRELFEDHSILLDLVDGADMLFAETIDTYFSAQVFSLIFEMYWFWRSMTGDEFQDARKLDIVFIILYILHSVIFLLLASFAGANVTGEAMDGLEVLRRKGMFGRKSPEELYFLMSLYVSYSGHFDIAISGGGYSNIDRSFLVGIVGTALCYFIVMIQFSHPLALAKDDPYGMLIKDQAKLIRHVEDTVVYFSRYDVEE